jgi:hypothetical protein
VLVLRQEDARPPQKRARVEEHADQEDGMYFFSILYLIKISILRYVHALQYIVKENLV